MYANRSGIHTEGGVGELGAIPLQTLEVEYTVTVFYSSESWSLLIPCFGFAPTGAEQVHTIHTPHPTPKNPCRSFNVISDPTEHLAKCRELCQTLASDMARERIKVGLPFLLCTKQDTHAGQDSHCEDENRCL